MSQSNDASGVRIIVADDNQDTASGLANLLRKTGFTVVATAYDGTAALAAIQAQRPTVAILDLVMPGLDGCEVAAAIGRWQPPRPHLIAISGLGRVWTQSDAAEAGFVASFPKPLNWFTLHSFLQRLVRPQDGDEKDPPSSQRLDAADMIGRCHRIESFTPGTDPTAGLDDAYAQWRKTQPKKRWGRE